EASARPASTATRRAVGVRSGKSFEVTLQRLPFSPPSSRLIGAQSLSVRDLQAAVLPIASHSAAGTSSSLMLLPDPAKALRAISPGCYDRFRRVTTTGTRA